MVIVDTTVLVDYFQGVRNAETDWLDAALERQRLGLTDIILCEVLQGVRDDPAAKAVERELAKLVVFETGGVALARDAPAVATRLLAATGSLRTEIGFAEGYYSIGDEVRERTLKDARELLGDAAFATAWTDGDNLSLEELAEEATLVD